MSQFYNITEKYHEQKGDFIHVLRLIRKVSKEDFSSLRGYAKNYDGYYSSYRGVNGFVFKNESDAEAFGVLLDNFFEKVNIGDNGSLSESTSPLEPVAGPAKEAKSKEKLPEQKDRINITSGMPLHLALRQIIDAEGSDIINDLRLVNILDDFQAYDSIPASKYILRAIIADGYAAKLLNLGQWDNSAKSLADKFTAMTGFMPDNVNRIFEALVYGLKWEEKSGQKAFGQPKSIPKNNSNDTHEEQDSNESILKETLFVFKSEEKYGLINCCGEIILEAKFDDLHGTGSFNYENIIFTKIGNKYGFYNVSEHIEIPPIYDTVHNFCCDLARVKREHLYGYIDRYGKEVIPCQYYYADDFSEGRAVVSKYKRGAKKSIIDASGKTVVPHIYKSINFFLNGRAEVSVDEIAYGYIDLNGKIIVPLEYCRSFFHGKYDLVRSLYEDTYHLIDTEGNVLLKLDALNTHWYLFDSYEHQGQTYLVLSRSDYESDESVSGVIDMQGNTVIPFAYSHIDTYGPEQIRVQIDDLHGIMSTDGRLLIDIISEEPTSINHEYAIIKQNGLYGIMKTGSEWILPCRFKEINQPYIDFCGNFIVQKGTKWGVINVNQEWVIPRNFDFIEQGNNTHYIVKSRNHAQIIDTVINKKIGDQYQEIFPIAQVDSYLGYKNHVATIFDLNGKTIKTFHCEDLISPFDSYYNLVNDFESEEEDEL